uniref:Uncharacterized protein n=1 Tax=Rhizophora mucronata TaxID=61149 RepID=A0A2P2KL70_RHIMU
MFMLAKIWVSQRKTYQLPPNILRMGDNKHLSLPCLQNIGIKEKYKHMSTHIRWLEHETIEQEQEENYHTSKAKTSLKASSLGQKKMESQIEFLYSQIEGGL